MKFRLSLLAGILLWLSWYPIGIAIFIFIAFVPLFFVSAILLEEKVKFSFWNGLCYTFPAFLIWNGATTWWIGYTTIPGAVAAVFLNTLLMSILFSSWHFLRKKGVPTQAAPLMFIAFWCSFEYLHLHWQIAWPWLNLGNALAPYTPLAQWYEYTGTFGGTIWILAMNFLIYNLIKSWKTVERKKYILATSSVFAIPICISLIIYFAYSYSDKQTVSVLIVQPNVEAKQEDGKLNDKELAQQLIDISAPFLDDDLGLLVAPESAISRNVSAELLLKNSYPQNQKQYAAFTFLDSVVSQYPRLNMIFGASTYRVFSSRERASVRALGDGMFREYYNSAILLNQSGVGDIYHKSKLVPGVELMPYPGLFRFLENTIAEMGGFSYGVDHSQHAFRTTIGDGVKVGAPICYESIFGEHFARFVKDGAELMAVITNDDWWEDSPGYKQHFIYSKLRAVETRRTIIRSANSGISAFIDEKGDILQKTAFREQTAILQTVTPNDKITFYVKHGDYLARIAVAVTVLFLLFGVYLIVRPNSS